MTPIALIVEDRPEIAAIWGKYLEPLEISIIHAMTLDEAYVVLKKIPPPDLVLLDLNLNEVQNADYTVRQIAHIKTFNPNMVVIVISGMLTPELTKIAGEQGASAIRSKIEMQNQVDLWDAIQESLNNAPQLAKGIFAHPLNLLEKLSQKLHQL